MTDGQVRRMRWYLGTERAAEDYCDERVDGNGRKQYLDKVVSVSGLGRDGPPMIFDEGVLDEQHRRFLSALNEE